MMLGDIPLWQFLLLIINALIAVAGFIISFSIARLIKSIDRLTQEDKHLHERISEHREDVLRNYIRSETVTHQIDTLRKDVIGRMDRMDISFKEALIAHEHREREENMLRIKAGG